MSSPQILRKKIVVKAELETLSGLHIGGSDVGLKIGGADKVVVKDPRTGRPYIPGSTLKGKIRCLLEKAGFCCPSEGGPFQARYHDRGDRGKPKWGSCQCGKCLVCQLFGVAAEKAGGESNIRAAGRLIFRDAQLSEDSAREMENWRYLSAPYVEAKTEVSIDRVTSAANPRNFERVPAGARFELVVVIDIFDGDPENDYLDLLRQGFELLQNDYLGGQGSRGYGWVRIDEKNIEATAYDTSTMKETKLDLSKIQAQNKVEASGE
jgi:CRISPR-associated protein Csm3